MIAIIDYGAGNLFSVCNALDALEAAHTVTSDPDLLRQADGLILPGVGAFPDAMRRLTETGLVPVIRELAGQKPFLGICLGMQLLFEKGYEFEEVQGLGLLPGIVRQIHAPGCKIPHMGWNDLSILHPCPLTEGLHEGSYVYFVHSYCAETDEKYISCSTLYGERIPALVCKGNIYGAQFHPEKSGEEGLAILSLFVRFCE